MFWSLSVSLVSTDCSMKQLEEMPSSVLTMWSRSVIGCKDTMTAMWWILWNSTDQEDLAFLENFLATWSIISVSRTVLNPLLALFCACVDMVNFGVAISHDYRRIRSGCRNIKSKNIAVFVLFDHCVLHHCCDTKQKCSLFSIKINVTF